MFLLDSDSGLHVSDVTEAPAAARDVDDVAPLVTVVEGRLATTSAENPDSDAARA